MANPKCEVCETELKNVAANQWMCVANLTVCENSTKVKFINPEKEEIE